MEKQEIQEQEMIDAMIEYVGSKPEMNQKPSSVTMIDGTEYDILADGSYRRKVKKMNKWERMELKKKNG